LSGNSRRAREKQVIASSNLPALSASIPCWFSLKPEPYAMAAQKKKTNPA
jgi:hypothetical protein